MKLFWKKSLLVFSYGLNANAPSRWVNAPTDTAFWVFLCFYVRLGLLNIVLKLEQDCKVARVSVLKRNG